MMNFEASFWVELGVQMLGIALAGVAVMKTRTSQGAVAWSLSLVIIPAIAIPLYLIFGLKRFEGYIKARRIRSKHLAECLQNLRQQLPEYHAQLQGGAARFEPFEKLVGAEFVRGNDIQLLIDGHDTFDAIENGILSAQKYILMQFYIVRDDVLGRRLQKALIDRARQGVRCYVLVDAIGSHDLSDEYIGALTDAGVQVRVFKSSKTFQGRFQINFRNHRKIMVVDGCEAFIGGFNVGDEYMGLDPKLGRWRDTHIRVCGVAALQAQISFLEDWYWSTEEIPELNWTVDPARESDRTVLMLPTGPTDVPDACALFFTECINVARERLWISTPYFVPDQQVIAALKLACMRGVDVRLLMAGITDNRLSKMASYAFLREILQWGVKIFRYEDGFMHQKALVVDDDLAVVGTANFDNRSFRLNFEISVLCPDRDVNFWLAEVFEKDMELSSRLTLEQVDSLSLSFQFRARLASLLAPVL